MSKKRSIFLGVIFVSLCFENAYGELEHRKLSSLKRQLSPKGKLEAHEWQPRHGKESPTRLPIFLLTDGHHHWVYKEVHQDEYDRLKKVQSTLKTAKIPEELTLTIPLLQEIWKGDGHGSPYVLMERAHGRSIGELLERLLLCERQGEPVDIAPLVEGMGRLGDALGRFHSQGLLNPWEIEFKKLKSTRVHGKLRAEKVFLSQGRVTFIDLEAMADSFGRGMRLSDDIEAVAFNILKLHLLFMDIESDLWKGPSLFQKELIGLMTRSFLQSYGDHFPLQKNSLKNFLLERFSCLFVFEDANKQRQEFEQLLDDGSPTPLIALDQASRHQPKGQGNGHGRPHHHTHPHHIHGHENGGAPLVDGQKGTKNKKVHLKHTA